MLEFLRGKASERKLRLFVCALCRRIWHLLTDQRSRDAVELAELCADDRGGIFRWVRRKLVCGRVLGAVWEEGAKQGWRTETPMLAALIALERWDDPIERVAVAARTAAFHLPSDERRSQADLLRCIFGNPFRPSIVNLSGLSLKDDTVRNLAHSIYEERAFDRLPILADALEDAGCTDAAILEHCRGPGPHVRGCCVVALLLGKQ